MSIIKNISKEELQNIFNCSKSYKDVLIKLGYKHTGNNHETLKKYIELYDISLEQFNSNKRQLYKSRSRQYNNAEEFIDFLNSGNCNLRSHTILQRLIEFKIKKYECERCGISLWNGLVLVLELHHKDKNHRNNEFCNLEILCPNCHSLEHYSLEYIYHTKSVKPNDISKIKKLHRFCADCGCIISNHAKRCKSCAAKIRQTKISKNRTLSNRPSKNELKKQIQSMSFVAIGKLYGVSDNTIRKWCKNYNLPYHKKDMI